MLKVSKHMEGAFRKDEPTDISPQVREGYEMKKNASHDFSCEAKLDSTALSSLSSSGIQTNKICIFRENIMQMNHLVLCACVRMLGYSYLYLFLCICICIFVFVYLWNPFIVNHLVRARMLG